MQSDAGKGDCEMYLERDCYEKLMEWKNSKKHSTLEVNGARQVGKTYLINYFADKNFKNKIYINLFELTGKQFLQCYQQANQWQPGQKRPEHPLHDAIRLYAPDFEDNEETVVIIDEIQESADIYNRIREFTRQFRCRFIVTGSYLGRVLEPEFRYSSGDVTNVRLYTLSFHEFLLAVDREIYERTQKLTPNKSENDMEIYKRLQGYYEVYCKIGGYPAVVRTYLQTRNFEKCQEELVQIINTFLNESMRYFTDITDISVFTNIFLSICRILLREKKGLEENSISEELQKLVVKNYSSNVTKAECYRAINWLYHSGIIGFCGKIIEMDILDFKPGRRCYFMDLGLAYYYLKRVGADAATVVGLLNENYVYINLLKRQDFPEEIAFETPAFATYKGGEIDFVVKSLFSGKCYGVEVKSGKNTGKSVNKALQSGKIQEILYLKGNTKGGQEGKVNTVPIWLLERWSF